MRATFVATCCLLRVALPHVVLCVLLSARFLLHVGRWRSFRYLYSGWLGFIAATSRLDGVPSSVITPEWRAAWNRTVQRTIEKAQTHTTLCNMRRRARADGAPRLASARHAEPDCRRRRNYSCSALVRM
jgi:hypothetical protein